jgi:predicted methyltransferase
MKRLGAMTKWVLALVLACSAHPVIAQTAEALLDQAIAGEHRSRANKARDIYRHPRETLLFFGLKPEMTVVEIWPAAGWYSEILAPVLRDKGKLYLAHVAIENPKLQDWQRESRAKLEAMVAKNPERFGKPLFTSLGPPDYVAIAPPASADLVLTFRNVHNWSLAKTDEVVFKAFYDALKPGGILGVVEHRAQAGTALEQQVKSGYMTEAYVIELAQKAGFRLLEKSEINANPKDTRDHPHGVWTLPPMNRGVLLDRDKYRAIGESDRMTLKFEKPSAAASP